MPKQYIPHQQPPFPKRELSLAIAVICAHFREINAYYGFKPADWSATNTVSSSNNS